MYLTARLLENYCQLCPGHLQSKEEYDKYVLYLGGHSKRPNLKVTLPPVYLDGLQYFALLRTQMHIVYAYAVHLVSPVPFQLSKV